MLLLAHKKIMNNQVFFVNEKLLILKLSFFVIYNLRLLMYFNLFFTPTGFDGSGGDNMMDAGSCIDGRLTSAWNWCQNLRQACHIIGVKRECSKWHEAKTIARIFPFCWRSSKYCQILSFLFINSDEFEWKMSILPEKNQKSDFFRIRSLCMFLSNASVYDDRVVFYASWI